MRYASPLAALLDRVATTRAQVGDRWPYHADLETPGMIVDGCFTRPKRFAERNELIWTTAYAFMAHYYLETSRVPCQPFACR